MTNEQMLLNLANSCGTIADQMKRTMSLSPEAYTKLHEKVETVEQNCKDIMKIISENSI